MSLSHYVDTKHPKKILVKLRSSDIAVASFRKDGIDANIIPMLMALIHSIHLDRRYWNLPMTCWNCNKKFNQDKDGRNIFVLYKDPIGNEHKVHKNCSKSLSFVVVPTAQVGDGSYIGDGGFVKGSEPTIDGDEKYE